MKITIVIIKFLFIGALFIVSNENLHLSVPTERSTFFDNFFSWLDTLFGHSLEIVGYVVNSEWLPQEQQQSSLLEQIG
jgi:hypothetical protein